MRSYSRRRKPWVDINRQSVVRRDTKGVEKQKRNSKNKIVVETANGDEKTVLLLIESQSLLSLFVSFSAFLLVAGCVTRAKAPNTFNEHWTGRLWQRARWVFHALPSDAKKGIIIINISRALLSFCLWIRCARMRDRTKQQVSLILIFYFDLHAEPKFGVGHAFFVLTKSVNQIESTYVFWFSHWK